VQGCLLMANARADQHRPILGGWAQPNRCTKADLAQYLYDAAEVEAAPSLLLYRPLARDIRQVYRLGRAALKDYQGKRRDAWKLKHLAFAEALQRVHQVGVRLCLIAGRWFAEVCLRRVFREVWREQFGPKVAYPEALKPFLEKVQVTLLMRNVVVQHLRPERAAGYLPPASFEELVLAHEAGEWPPELTEAYKHEKEWEKRVPVRWV
jgi:hypothetical protein